MNYIAISDNAARQTIDVITIWSEYQKVWADAKPYKSGMYWKKEGIYEYLVKTHSKNRQERLGVRSEQTEKIYLEFHKNRNIKEGRLQSITQALVETQRLNKALKVGRTPDVVVSLLNGIKEAGLQEYFLVVGTHALYAYEVAAGVRIVAGAMATQDVDLLWDARKRVKFVVDLHRDAGSMLALLQRVDPSFRRCSEEGQNESAINDKGFMVDFLRRETEDGDAHPFRFSDDEEDFWPVQAQRASMFFQAPAFQYPVISATGKMATMRTIDPKIFVDFKLWLSNLTESREIIKRRRDLQQANIVKQLLDEGLLLDAAGTIQKI